MALAEWKGKFAGHVRVKLDSRELDKTELVIAPEDHCDFVAVPAMADLRRFREPFMHSVVEPDGTVFEMETGPGTANWTSLEDINPFFVHAVLAHEDGGFFTHHGFSLRHIRDALVRNLKEGRYVVGASTITMQLVKNVFLHREKTLARKIQEVLLTWWIERVMEKRDIIELYLNVIEYGPSVYGIRNGARHYFNRLPSQLSPAESVYLATILPNPKRYHSFLDEGALVASWMSQMRQMLARLKERGSYSQEATDYGLHEIEDFHFHPEGTIVPPRQLPGGAATLPYLQGAGRATRLGRRRCRVRSAAGQERAGAGRGGRSAPHRHPCRRTRRAVRAGAHPATAGTQSGAARAHRPSVATSAAPRPIAPPTRHRRAIMRLHFEVLEAELLRSRTTRRHATSAPFAIESGAAPHAEDAFLDGVRGFACARNHPAHAAARARARRARSDRGHRRRVAIAARSRRGSRRPCSRRIAIEDAELCLLARAFIEWLVDRGRLSLHGQRLLARRMARFHACGRPVPPRARRGAGARRAALAALIQALAYAVLAHRRVRIGADAALDLQSAHRLPVPAAVVGFDRQQVGAVAPAQEQPAAVGRERRLTAHATVRIPAHRRNLLVLELLAVRVEARDDDLRLRALRVATSSASLVLRGVESRDVACERSLRRHAAGIALQRDQRVVGGREHGGRVLAAARQLEPVARRILDVQRIAERERCRGQHQARGAVGRQARNRELARACRTRRSARLRLHTPARSRLRRALAEIDRCGAGVAS